MGKYKNFNPVEVNIPLKNHPITVSHIVISGSSSNGSANLKFPLIPKGKFGELITKNNEYDGAEDIGAVVTDIDVDIWRVVEIAPDQMTTAESTDDRALNET